MPKLKSYGILTSGEISKAEHLGTLSIADHLSCPFCDGTITRKPVSERLNNRFARPVGCSYRSFGRYIRVAYRFSGFQELKILQTTTQKKSNNPPATTYKYQGNGAGQSLTKFSYISIRSPSQKRQNSGRRRNPHHKGFRSLSRNSSRGTGTQN